jgi:hypothetical protein
MLCSVALESRGNRVVKQLLKAAGMKEISFVSHPLHEFLIKEL